MTDRPVTEIRCTTCGLWFPSSIQFGTPEDLEHNIFEGNTTLCPNGHVTGHDKENMRMRHSGGGFVGDETV